MKELAEKLQARLNGSVLGSEETVFEFTAALFAGGHILIEGAPGIGKTTLVRTLATSLSGSFKRVQFTPDLVPSDLVGYSVYRQKEGVFEFIEGPVFTNLLLADEINRTNPRIQSALLECMNERQVSIDGETHPLPEMFHVIATQNNRYTTGTFPLPEPQLDRFLASVEMSIPDEVTRSAILQLHANDPVGRVDNGDKVGTVEEIVHCQEQVRNLPVSEEISRYIIRLCDAASRHEDLEGEVSNRGSIAVMRMAQAIASIREHAGVYPEDVKQALLPTLSHRLFPAGEEPGFGDASIKRKRVTAVLAGLLESVPVE